MLTSAECRAQAEQKLAQAEHDDRNRSRLITAAEAWLLLASQLRRVEAALSNNEVVTKRRSKKAWWLRRQANPRMRTSGAS
jgi:hypothetical protein